MPSVLDTGKRVPKGTKVGISVGEAPAVTFTVNRLRKGARRDGKCVAGARRKRGERACTKRTKADTIVRVLTALDDLFAFSGKVGGKALAPGRYELRGVATDVARNASAAKAATFKIVG